MKFFVGVTDNQWFDYLRWLSVQLSARPSDPSCPSESLDEVNFWQLGGGSMVKTLQSIKFCSFSCYFQFAIFLAALFFLHLSRLSINPTRIALVL